jgi:hypothetical protein
VLLTCKNSVGIPAFGSQDIGWVVVFNATFHNISVITWQSVLLVGETGVPGENHQPVAGQ